MKIQSPARMTLHGTRSSITLVAVAEEVTYKFHETPPQKLHEWRGGILTITADQGIQTHFRVVIPWHGYDEDLRKSFIISLCNNREIVDEEIITPERVDAIAEALVSALARRYTTQKGVNIYQICPGCFSKKKSHVATTNNQG